MLNTWALNAQEVTGERAGGESESGTECQEVLTSSCRQWGTIGLF